MLPRDLVSEAMQTGILKKLSYPLPATTFTRKQCKEILSPVLWQGLPKAGIGQTMPREIVHAPLEEGGLAVPDLYVE